MKNKSPEIPGNRELWAKIGQKTLTRRPFAKFFLSDLLRSKTFGSLKISVGDPLNTIFDQFSKINSRENLPKNLDSLKKSAKITRNFERFVFQFLSENLLKSVSTKGGIRGPSKIFFEKSTQLEVYLNFFWIVCSILFVKSQLREAVGIICEYGLKNTLP